MNKITKALVAAVAAIGLTQVASAVPYPTTTGLLLWDSTGAGTSAYVPLDSNGNAVYTSGIGSWSIALSAGSTVKAGYAPEIDLAIINATPGAGASSLYVFFTSGPFTVGLKGWNLTAHETSGDVQALAYANTGFPVVNPTHLLGSLTVPTTGVTTGVNGTYNSGANPYYLTVEDIITPHSGAGAVSVDTNLKVPDGGATVMLLGMGLSGVALLRRKLVA